jgi:Entericidin EcnA/B family.
MEGDTVKRLALFVLLLAVCAVMFGCGETVSGLGKDVNRMGRGMNTFFFRQ